MEHRTRRYRSVGVAHLKVDRDDVDRSKIAARSPRKVNGLRDRWQHQALRIVYSTI